MYTLWACQRHPYIHPLHKESYIRVYQLSDMYVAVATFLKVWTKSVDEQIPCRLATTTAYSQLNQVSLK